VLFVQDSLKYIVDNPDTSLNFANASNIFSVLEVTNQKTCTKKL
jgi:hypothetical protein